MLCLFLLWQLLFIGAAFAANGALIRRNNSGPPSHFVTTKNGQFFVNGSAFSFIGTNAYWLSSLNTEEDIDHTLGNISAAGIKVVRTWAFNDVTSIPENGTWFQLIANGTTRINDGQNGLQRLDKVVQLAQKHGIYLLLSLTNNWSPLPNETVPVPNSEMQRRQIMPVPSSVHPRGTLSNDYGGMDVYVRQLGDIQAHDQFYVNQTLINAFQNYTSVIASRYANQSSVLAWEIANDPRCNSTLGSAPSCNPLVVTDWHSTMAQHIKTMDPNHLVASGHQGFFCMGCPKRFPRTVPAPPPAPVAPPAPPPPRPSPGPGRSRRWALAPLTKGRILKQQRDTWKKFRKLARRSSDTPAAGVRIRGKWIATPARRQDEGLDMSSFDGSHGVDSEDIINIPQIGFGSFQLFPDQNSYGNSDPTLPPFNNTVQIGLKWIAQQAATARLFGKPITLIGFGLVTAGNRPLFTPFNSTIAPFGPDQAPDPAVEQAFGFTDELRDDAYRQWLAAGQLQGVLGMIQYQWSQGNLTAQPGTTIEPSITDTPVAPNEDVTGTSPNDGYGILGQGESDVIGVMQEASQNFGPG